MSKAFTYELEAARVRAGHRLEQATQRVADAQVLLQREETARTALLDEIGAIGRQAGASAGQRFDPQQALARTAHLVRLRQRMGALEQIIQDRHQALTRALEEMRARQAERESLERHREQQLAQHLHTLAARSAVEADHDWLARSAWRESDAAGSWAKPSAHAARKGRT